MVKIPILIQSFGNSMIPFFRDGDVIIFKKIPFQKVKVDDFAVFKRNGLFVTHRVIYTNFKHSTGFIITKGDNNLLPDKKVYSKDFLGIVSQVKRGKIVNTSGELYLMQSALYYSELIKLKKQFELNNLDCLILKGLPLHLYLEKTHPKRIYADCDLLIRPDQFEKVRSILNGMGYQIEDDKLTSAHQKLKDRESEVTFSKSLEGFKVFFDIHLQPVFLMTQLGNLTALYPARLVDQLSDDFFKNKQQVKLNNDRFNLLSNEHLFIYLLLHLFHHNFTGYNRYQVIDLLVRKKFIDYEKVLEIIEKFKLRNFIYPGVLLLKKYYFTPLPTNFVRKIMPIKKIANKIQGDILTINIFGDDFRISSGVKRFKLIYDLSPNNFFGKNLIILNPQVIYSVYWVIKKRLKLFWRNHIFRN